MVTGSVEKVNENDWACSPCPVGVLIRGSLMYGDGKAHVTGEENGLVLSLRGILPFTLE